MQRNKTDVRDKDRIRKWIYLILMRYGFIYRFRPGNVKNKVMNTADIIIRNGKLVTMNPAYPAVIEQTIVIENGKITKIGETDEKADKIIDAKGCIVMPGLSNTHTHLGMTLFRGYGDDMMLQDWLQNRIWPAEACLDARLTAAGSRLACLEMIRSGTTACCDMYFYMDDVARAVEESGMRASLSYGMIELGDEAKGRKELEIARKFVADRNGTAGGRITTMYGPHAPTTCSEDFLARVREQATKDGVGIHIHVLETEAELKQIEEKHGMCPIHLLDKIDFWGPDVLAAHAVWMSDRDIKIFADKGVKVSHNAISNMKLASGIAPIHKMVGAGVNVSLGTDGCASNNSLDMFEEMKTASLLQKVSVMDPTAYPAEEVVRSATVNGGSVIDPLTGMLKEGNKADIIILDVNKAHLTPNAAFMNPGPYSHLVYAARGSDVKTVIIDGKTVMEDYTVLTMDEEKVREDAEKAAAELFEKVRGNRNENVRND